MIVLLWAFFKKLMLLIVSPLPRNFISKLTGFFQGNLVIHMGLVGFGWNST
jgi:ABC-type microcin C transport system permease subunit YejB